MDLLFEKYQGCGNDFIIIDNLDQKIELDEETIRFLCDPHFGIGADGLILLGKKKFYHMNYFNKDGTRAEICGNGLRCLSRYLLDHGMIGKEANISSDAGLTNVKIKGDLIEVEMPKAILLDLDSFDFDDKNVNYGIVDIGNPHLILQGDRLEDFPVEIVGPMLEKGSYFKDGINVNFVEVLDRNHVRLKTWERGDGLTLACGSGASATVYYLNQVGLVDDEVSVSVPGGELKIKVTEDEITMAGPAKYVFKGELEI